MVIYCIWVTYCKVKAYMFRCRNIFLMSVTLNKVTCMWEMCTVHWPRYANWAGWGMNEFKSRTRALIISGVSDECGEKVTNWPIFSRLWKSFGAKNNYTFFFFNLRYNCCHQSALNSIHLNTHMHIFSVLSLYLEQRDLLTFWRLSGDLMRSKEMMSSLHWD